MTPDEVVALLEQVKPLQLKAVALLVRLHQDGVTPTDVLDYYDAIAEAQESLDEHVDTVRGVVRRCQQLPPVPSRTTPIGI